MAAGFCFFEVIPIVAIPQSNFEKFDTWYIRLVLRQVRGNVIQRHTNDWIRYYPEHDEERRIVRSLMQPLRFQVSTAPFESGIKDCYNIKLRASGFRLVYQVIDCQLIIAVVAAGKRERSEVYTLASERIR